MFLTGSAYFIQMLFSFRNFLLECPWATLSAIVKCRQIFCSPDKCFYRKNDRVQIIQLYEKIYKLLP